MADCKAKNAKKKGVSTLQKPSLEKPKEEETKASVTTENETSVPAKEIILVSSIENRDSLIKLLKITNCDLNGEKLEYIYHLIANKTFPVLKICEPRRFFINAQRCKINFKLNLDGVLLERKLLACKKKTYSIISETPAPNLEEKRNLLPRILVNLMKKKERSNLENSWVNRFIVGPNPNFKRRTKFVEETPVPEVAERKKTISVKKKIAMYEHFVNTKVIDMPS